MEFFWRKKLCPS